jgi:non-reducing end alpha-L-arabinofuranosidase
MSKSKRSQLIRTALAFGIGAAIPSAPAWALQGPCDIYAAGGTPCVAAYSTVRVLSGSYTGPLYQVRRTSDGKTLDIAADASGYAQAAAQDDFLGTGAGTISILYDQSGKANHLTKAPAGCYTGTASQPDNESNAKGRSLTVGGHKVYALYMIPQDGYRNNKTTGMPTGSAAQGIYEIADGKRIGDACCWDFGNASTNNCNGGTGNMNTLYFGTGYWGKGEGKGPWFLADLENGVWAGGTGASNAVITSNPSMAIDYAFGILKTNATNYAIRTANAQSGSLKTAYDGNTPVSLRWAMHGGIVLGIGGDNSNSSKGTFFEGAITAGRPTDATDDLILKNVQAAGYGSNVIGIGPGGFAAASGAAPLRAGYERALGRVSLDFEAQAGARMTLGIYDHRGKRIARLVDGILPRGSHRAIWDAKGVPAGFYVARLSGPGRMDARERILIGR